MNADTILQVTRQDVTLVRRTLRQLTAAQKLLCTVVILITAVIWWLVVKALLAFGRGVDYSGLHALGTRTVTLLQQYNPFFWWGVVALFTLLLVYLLYGFVAATQRTVQRKLVSRTTAERLIPNLSPGGREVLEWGWQDRRDPITVEVLQRTLAEMRGGRAGKITLARQHQSMLNTVVVTPPTQPDALATGEEI